MSNQTGVVYALLSPSGKLYIGQAQDFRIRHFRHGHEAKTGGRWPIHRAIRKYGLENFKIFVLAESDNRDWRDFYEILLIDLFRSREGSIGYNVAIGGQGNTSKKSPEIRAKMSAVLIGHQRMKGMKQSPEWISKRIASQRGVSRSVAVRQKISASLRGIPKPENVRSGISAGLKRFYAQRDQG